MNAKIITSFLVWWTMALIPLPLLAPRGAAEDRLATLAQTPMPKDANLTSDGSRLLGLLQPKAVAKQWTPRANDEQTRGGLTLSLYPKVAPAVVVVRTEHGHGTGFVVDPEGWILTNHHVIDDGEVDPETNTQGATVYFGRLQEGWMTVIEKGVRAEVYKASEDQDLALLKLCEKPQGLGQLPSVALADKTALPGSDCLAIGHPAAGMLWTVRSGEVSGAGRWPAEMIDVVMERLVLTGQDRQRLDELLRAAPQRKVIISTCGLNPGDSGGPLVDSEGKLLAVSFAIPRASGDSGISLDKFSYHIHLDEVKAFTAQRPNQPLVVAPKPWPAFAYHALVDSDRDGTGDTLLCFADPHEPPVGILMDLDQDSAKRRAPKGADDAALEEVWDFEFALHKRPLGRSFYDTDNDGTVDLVLTDRDGDEKPEGELSLQDGQWKSQKPKSDELVDPLRFKDRGLRKALAR